jgi:hypothetical protein
MKKEHIDYMQVKAASEVMEEVRGQALQMIWQYRAWRKRRAGDLMKSTHLLMHDDLMQAQIRDMLQLYRATHRDYHDLYRRCMKAIQPNPPPGEKRRGGEAA